jgi:osmotically-inducible protein OsmY
MAQRARSRRWVSRSGASTALIAALCHLPSCGAREPTRPARGAEDARPSVVAERAAPRQTFSDTDIRLAVARKLEHAISLPAPLVDISVADGIVTLTGRVNRGDERLRVAALAEQTRGVRAVVNRVVVEPGWAPSADLAAKVRARLLHESEDEFANVIVSAEESRVRLEGSVARLRGKEMAERAAWYVAGVTDVDNHVRVRPTFVRTDQEMKENIVRSIRADAYIGGAPLRVSVEDGTARLSGVVQSMFERRRARERAMVAGVVDVDDDAVRVLPESAPSSAFVRPPASDGEVELAVRDAFRADPRVPEEGIDFRVDYGVVTLTGRVRTLAQKLAAGEDARNAVGTWGVVNRLEVRPERGTPVRGLEQRIMERLRDHPSVNADRVRPTVASGNVTLRGEVSSVFERTAAERAVATLPGVTAIENELTIRPSNENQRTDAEVDAYIERELWWDPRVGGATIAVTVENGIVTLRGEVPTAEVHGAVLETAFRARPRGVVDRLWQRHPRFLYSR